MTERIQLKDRPLPRYSVGEEVMNTATHITGGVLGVLVLITGLLKADSPLARWAMAIYGCSMIILYTMSSVYHGLKPGIAKRVMQVLDHCTINLLIAGTYTPILLCAFLPVYPGIAVGLLIMEWGLATVSITLTAIDLKKYQIFSTICYVFLGWGIIFFAGKAREVLTPAGFGWLLWGGIAYTFGVILYAIGSKKKWFHSVFHIFVVLGSLLQFISIYWYII